MAKVLIVDDDEPFRRVNAKSLELDGHHVLMARDGRDALTIVRAEHPDVVLLDIMMPGVDGYQVCRQIKDNPSTKDITVVMITARPESERCRSYQVGADIHIVKPISSSQMRELVRRVAEKGRT